MHGFLQWGPVLLCKICEFHKNLIFFLETCSLIFGSDNARLGAERLFELFQDIRLNKHLCYVRNKIIKYYFLFYFFTFRNY
jgi:hypothetical protein